MMEMENWQEPSPAWKMETKNQSPASTAAGNSKGMSELLLITSALLPSREKAWHKTAKHTFYFTSARLPCWEMWFGFFLGKLTLAYWQHHFSNWSVWPQLERAVKSSDQSLREGWILHHGLKTHFPAPLMSPPSNASPQICPCMPLGQQCIPCHGGRQEGWPLSVAWSKGRLWRRVTDLHTLESAYGEQLYVTVDRSKIILI